MACRLKTSEHTKTHAIKILLTLDLRFFCVCETLLFLVSPHQGCLSLSALSFEGRLLPSSLV